MRRARSGSRTEPRQAARNAMPVAPPNQIIREKDMQKRRLGRTGLEVSVLGYGAGAVGGLFTKGETKRPGTRRRARIEAGINYFDTAARYGDGESERISAAC